MGSTDKRSLFAIGADLEALEQLITEAEGDISDPKAEVAVQTWFDDLGHELAGKLDNYLWMIRKWESEQTVADAERDRMVSLAKTRANRIERLKSLLRSWMEQHQQNELVSATGRTIRLATNGGKRAMKLNGELAATILDNAYAQITLDAEALAGKVGNLSPDGIRPLITYHLTIDTDQLRRLLEAGASHPLAELMPSGRSLRLPK